MASWSAFDVPAWPLLLALDEIRIHTPALHHFNNFDWGYSLLPFLGVGVPIIAFIVWWEFSWWRRRD